MRKDNPGCDLLEKRMEEHRQDFENLKRKAEDMERRVVPSIRENNEKVKEIQMELGRLGVNAYIRNIPVRFWGGGIVFLEQLDAIDTKAENFSQTRSLMDKLSSVHRDAQDAVREVEEVVQQAEQAKSQYEFHKRAFEQGCS